jgi:hypothetical protein
VLRLEINATREGSRHITTKRVSVCSYISQGLWLSGPRVGVGREGFALIYLGLATPTVRSCGMMSAVLVTNMPVAPRSSSRADTMIAR